MRSSSIDAKGKTVQKQTKQVTHADRVLSYLKEQHRPLSAYDILEGLRSDGVTASTTVYRALEKLLDAGQVHRHCKPVQTDRLCPQPHSS